MKKIIALLIAVMMVVGLFAACGESKPEVTEVTLKIWAPTEDQANENSWLQTRLKAFETAHPNYKITWELGVCGEGDAANLVGTDPSAAGDIFMYANDQIGTLVEAGALAKLGGTYLDFVKNNYSATYSNSVTYKGEVYGFPMTCNTWFMYYNKKLVSDEDVKSLEKLLEKGTVAFPMTTAWYNGAFFLGNGGTLFGEAGNDEAAGIQFGGEAGYAAAKKMVELMANPNFVNDADSKGNSGLKEGSVVAYFDGSWNYAGLYEVLGEDLGAVALPTVNIGGKDVNMKSLAGSKVIGVNPNCKNQKVAMEVAAFLASEASQLARYEMRGIIPAHKNLATNDSIAKDFVAVAEMNTMNNASSAQPIIPEMSVYWDAVGNFGGNVVNKDVTLDNYQDMVDQLMNRLNASGI